MFKRFIRNAQFASALKGGVGVAFSSHQKALPIRFLSTKEEQMDFLDKMLNPLFSRGFLLNVDKELAFIIDKDEEGNVMIAKTDWMELANFIVNNTHKEEESC